MATTRKRKFELPKPGAAVPHVAAVPKVRDWMKQLQRDCVQFGHLVMEGRDIGTNIFLETDHKFYLDANLEERSKRREADGIDEDLMSEISATISRPPPP